MPRYASTASVTSGSAGVATKTLALVAATTVRPRVYELLASSSQNPADNVLNWLMQRISSSPGGTDIDEVKLDTNDPAALSTAKQAFTASLDTTTTLLDFAMNQRSTFRWVAAPGGEIVIPATANAGVGITVATSPTGSVPTKVSLYWSE